MPSAVIMSVINTLVGPFGLIGGLFLNAIGIPVSTGLIGDLLGIGPKGPKPSDGQQTSRNALASRRRYYGIVNSGGTLSFLESRNGTLGIVVTLGTGEDSEILEHKINDNVVTVSGGTVTEASYRGALHIYTRMGTADQTAIGEVTAKFPEWTSDHRQRGCAHAAIIGDPVKQKYFSEVYNGQMPQYTQTRKASKLYDPRKDSTMVIGTDGAGAPVYGAGAHRLDNQATWEWNDLASLVIADYFAHPDGYGGGYDNVNWANIAQNAAFDAVTQTTVTGDVIARWRLWGGYSLATDERRAVLEDMRRACDAFFWQDADAKFCLMTGRWEEPDLVITDDHVLGLSARLGPGAQARMNAVKVTYTDALAGYREQESATFAFAGAADDPATDPKVVEVFFAPHHNQAVRVGKLTLARAEDDRWHINGTLNLFGLNLIGKRFCRLELAQLGVEGWFAVSGLRLNMEQCTIDAMFDEVKPEDWNFDAATEEGTPPNIPESELPSIDIPAPTGLVVSAVQINLGETNGVAIAASWSTARDGLSFRAQYRPSAGGDWIAMAVDQDALTARSGPVDSGIEYEVEVIAMTVAQRESAPVSDTITPVASALISAPTELAAIGSSGKADVSFRMPTQPSLAYARLYRNTVNNFGSAVQVGGDIVGGLGAVIAVSDTGLSAGTKYYWARAFKADGGSSSLAGPVTATVT